ncbi:TY-Chap domain-containing protein [Yinghuangia soli]|uniref:TY-Chap N-terminal domain-containing protein n=1 Tax=Yinghuangia soli TaxID=2908204 RepID=A0AA41U3Z4_9ACTN|nr:hypothetical protein [Yinghuangia soli]MCF2533248.1 hypothetical protein [Yinghuangia soli]
MATKEPSVWDALLRSGSDGVPAVADLLWGEEVAAQDRVRIGPPDDAASVTLTRYSDRHVIAEVFLPEGEELTRDQEQQLTALGWEQTESGTSPIRPTWCLEWRWYADAETRAPRGRAIVAALRDVLALPADRLTVRGWGNDGPFRAYGFEEFDDRPSLRAATGPCTDWHDLRTRLDWVLSTLPADAAVVIAGPGNSVVQFMTTFGSTVHTSAMDSTLDAADLPTRESPGDERHRTFFDDGWEPSIFTAGMAEWTLGEPVIHAGAGPLARKAVTALRLLGAGTPKDLRIRAFRNGRRPDPDYVFTELGLERL